MEPPASFEAEAVRNEKVKLLQSIRLPTVDDIDRIAACQYTRGGTLDDLMPGYRDEPGVNPLSRTETYAALRLDVDNWRWAAPFYVRTGKRLPKRITEVVLQFMRPPHLPIRLDQATGLSPDALILRIQPDEGITLRFGAKVPGHSFMVSPATMEFNYEATFVESLPRRMSGSCSTPWSATRPSSSAPTRSRSAGASSIPSSVTGPTTPA